MMDIFVRAAGLSDKSTNKEILNLVTDAIDAATDKIEGQRKEIERLREELHQISLASQSSMDSKEGCGKIARKALGEKE